MSGITQGTRSWYDRSENEVNVDTNGYHPKASGWQTETEYEDATSQYSVENYQGKVHEPRADISQRMRKIFDRGIYTDVRFVVSCGIKPKPSLSAHKAVLVVGSPVFEEMFNKQEAVKQDLIQINAPFHAFRSVVEYLYTDEVYFEKDFGSRVKEVLAAAKSFKVPALEARCIAYLESSEITESNVCTRLQLATTQKIEEYKKQCVEFIQDNTGAVIRSADFKATDLSTVRNICKLSKLCLSSEMELFEGVMEWVNVQTDSCSKKRQILDPLLRHIRFLSMSAPKFSHLVSTYPDIFTAEEALNIIVYLSKPGSESKAKLPEWCNKGSNRCTNVQGAERDSPNRNIKSMERKISICLRPIKKGHTPNLMCELQLKCIKGNHKIKALKLSFGQPVTTESYIKKLIINVYSKSNGYSFKEHHMIHNASEVIVPFTQTLTARMGNIIHISAEALFVKNYYFLQFDEQNSFLEDSPFECKLNSEPKGNRLFFISEVIFEDLPVRRRPPTSYRRRL